MFEAASTSDVRTWSRRWALLSRVSAKTAWAGRCVSARAAWRWRVPCCPKGCRPPRQRVRNDKSERNSPGCRNIRSQEDRPRTSTSGQGPRARVHAHTTRCRLSAPQARHPTWIFTWVVVGSLIAHITHHELKQVAGPSSLPLAVLPAQHQRRHQRVTTARLCLIRRPDHFQFSQASTL